MRVDPEVELEGGGVMRMMHALDARESGLDNLHKLAERQTEQGEAQLRYAIEVVRQTMSSVPQEQGEAEVCGWIKSVAHFARSDAGTKLAKWRGIHVGDAFAPGAARFASYRRNRLPKLLPLMSEARRDEILSRDRPESAASRLFVASLTDLGPLLWTLAPSLDGLLSGIRLA